MTQPQRLETSAHRLLQAAVTLIAEKGWEATTAAEIGLRAGYSRAMVRTRYGSKDAILDAVFAIEYEEKLNPNPEPNTNGLTRALGHLDRIAQLYVDDPDLLRAIFVLTFEAATPTAQARPGIRSWLARAGQTVEAHLQAGITDGSVHPDADIPSAVNDFGGAVLGNAFQWVMQAYSFELGEELAKARARLIAQYGRASA